MKFYSQVRIDAATERPNFRDRADIDVTVLTTGDSSVDNIYIDGTPAERAAFLRSLGIEALAVADELDSQQAAS